MSRLLRGIFCVIETFHKYASEDGNKTTLTHRELRQLLEGEIGNFLQPCAFHAVEKKLNLLDIDRDDTISFEEFLLSIFSLLNLCDFGTSLLNSEPRLKSKSEKTNDVDLRAIARNSQQVVGAVSTQEKMASPAQPSNEEDEADGHTKRSPWEDTETHNLPREVSEPSDPETQHPEEDSQEVTQDIPATEYEGVRFKRNTAVDIFQQSISPTQEIPRGGEPVRRQIDAKMRDYMARRPSEDEERATGESIEKHSTIQDPFSKSEDKARSEHTDLPVESAAEIPSPTQRHTEPMDDTRLSESREPATDVERPPETTNSESRAKRTSEAHGLPVQERKQETQDQSIQNRSKNASEASSRDEREEEQKEHERKARPLVPEAQTQDERYREFQGSWRKNGAQKGSGTQDLSSEEGNREVPEIQDEFVSEKEARCAEEDTTDTFVINKHIPAAEETLGTRESSRKVAPLEKQSKGKNHRATRTHDKPARKEGLHEGEDPELPVTQNDEGSCGTSNTQTPEVGNSSSETGEPSVPGDLQSQVNLHGGSKQGSHNTNPDPQKQGAPGESNREQEAVVQSIQEEDGQLPEEQEEPARE